MRIDILTVVPELLRSPLNESILKRAQEKGLVEIVVHNLHDFAHDKRPYFHGIWHIFVLLGSISHWAAVLIFLISAK